MAFFDTGYPRVQLADTPTPFHHVPRFSEALGGPAIYLKRDDATGLALGGNKARKLEFLLADALREGADTVFTCGGPQSNHARMTAAASRKVGLSPVLILNGEDPGKREGNLLLDELLGAEIVFSGERPAAEVMAEEARKASAAGKRPYVVPMGGSNSLGALGYIACAHELASQCREAQISPTAIYLAAGSMGTLAGFLAGQALSGTGAPRVIGVSVSPGVDAKVGRTVELLQGIGELLGKGADFTESLVPRVTVTDAWVGPGYGVPTPQCIEAILLLSRTEGILADPVYTGKALAALIGDVRAGKYTKDDQVVFLHTGGAPANFAFTESFQDQP